MIRKTLQDYIHLSRLNRPIGIWLLLWPSLWGLYGPGQYVPIKYIFYFTMGAIVMRSAGCIYNDIIDRPFDGQVERTSNRPLVRPHHPLSLKWAYAFLICNLLLGLLILACLNSSCICLGFLGSILIFLYPWMKRWTYWPQLFLGFAMNFGLLMGWAAVTPSLPFQAILLYSGAVFWTLGYDTIYGLQDRTDDLMIGIKSVPILLYDRIRLFLSGCYSITIVLWGIFGIISKQSSFYYMALIFISIFLIYQVIKLDKDRPLLCLKLFLCNKWVGIILFAGIIL